MRLTRSVRSRWGIVLVAAALVIVFAHYRRARSESNPLAKREATAVPTAVASLSDIQSSVRVSGTITALRSVALLAPRIAGSRSGVNRGGDANFAQPPGGGGGGGGGADFNLVLLTLARPGTHVKTGDMVAQFDPQNQLQRLDDYKDSVLQLEETIKNMTANLAAAKESHDQAVRAAKAEWEKAVLDVQTAPVRSEIDVERYKLSAEEAEATYKQLQSESTLVEESQRAQLRISQLNRDQSRIELQRAEANVQKMTIHAPMDGIVVMANIVRNGELGQIREGDQVNAGQPFVYIVDPTSMVLDAMVNQVDAERLRLGMKGTVHIDAYPEISVPGTLSGIGAMAKTSTFRADYVGEIPTRIQIERLDPRLIPDLTGSAEIVLASESSAVVVPRAAVFGEDGSPFVFLRTAEGWVQRPVQIGIESNTAVAVREGLQKGDVIALRRPS